MSDSTLLEMCNTVAVEIKFPKIIQVVGNDDQGVMSIFAAIRKGLERDVYRGHQWAALRGYIEITFDGVTEFWPVPENFDSMMNQTGWDIVNQRPARGALDPYQWQMLTKSQLTIPNQELYFMITSHDFSGTTGVKKCITFYPSKPLSTSPNFSLGYMTNWYVLDHDTNQMKRKFTHDEDTIAIDSECVEQAALVRMLRSLGMGFQSEEEEFNELIRERRQKDGGSTNMDMTGPRSLTPAYPNTPGHVPVGHGRWGY